MNSCIKRIILDIADLQKDPIDNIRYYPNEDNIMNGCALIIGPENTPYQEIEDYLPDEDLSGILSLKGVQ